MYFVHITRNHFSMEECDIISQDPPKVIVSLKSGRLEKISHRAYLMFPPATLDGIELIASPNENTFHWFPDVPSKYELTLMDCHLQGPQESDLMYIKERLRKAKHRAIELILDSKTTNITAGWTEEQRRLLLQLAPFLSVSLLAKAFQKQPGTIYSRCKIHGLKFTTFQMASRYAYRTLQSVKEFGHTITRREMGVDEEAYALYLDTIYEEVVENDVPTV